jgi:hypothetical protein
MGTMNSLYISTSLIRDTPNSRRKIELNIKDNSVTTAKIKNKAVTTDKLADNSVTVDKLDSTIQKRLDSISYTFNVNKEQLIIK